MSNTQVITNIVPKRNVVIDKDNMVTGVKDSDYLQVTITINTSTYQLAKQEIVFIDNENNKISNPITIYEN